MAESFDVVVVGARCGGAATALLLARAGARVLLMDKGAYGADTLSTHALMRGAVLQLHRWGVLPAIEMAGTPPVRVTTFGYSSGTVVIPIESRYGVEALYAPRRALLDRTLVDAAVESGAEIRHGAHASDLIVDAGGRVRGVVTVVNGVTSPVNADVVIGADGLYSTVAGRVAAAPVVLGQHATGVLYSYWTGFTAEGYEWLYSSGSSVGIIPTNDGATCIFVSVPAIRFREEVRGDATDAYLRLVGIVSPAVAERLSAARRVERVRGFGGHVGFIKQGHGPGWALVGDAGYFKDPLTAHGITDALRDAELLACAIIQGTGAALAHYEATRLDLSRELFHITDTIASFTWSDDELQSLHRAFSVQMSREVRALASLEAFPCRSPLVSERPAV